MDVKNKSIEDILNSYSFPHRFLVRYAVACAEKAIEYVKDPDERTIKAVALAKRFGAGESIPQAELDAAARAASAAYSVAYSAAYYAAYSAAYAHYAVHSARYASCVSPASKEEEISCTEFLRDKLIQMIKEEYCEFELILMGVI